MTSFRTVKEIAIERAKECVEEVGNKFLDSVRPIYGISERSSPTPVLVGTCMFLKVDSKYFLVTAAHVIDHNRASTLYLGAGGSLFQIEGEFWETVAPGGDRIKDKMDFAFWCLAPSVINRLHDITFIDDSELSRNRGTMDGRQFLVMGYPISKNKDISALERAIRPKAWTYQSSFFDPGEKSAVEMGFSRSHHLFLKYDKRVGDYEGGLDNAIHPRGASGGTLIDLGLPNLANLASDAPCVGRLAGLFIERKEKQKLLVFVRIGVIIDLIRERFSNKHADEA